MDTIITATLDSPSAPPSHCSRQTETRETDEGRAREMTPIHTPIAKCLFINAVENARAPWPGLYATEKSMVLIWEIAGLNLVIMVCVPVHVRKIVFMSSNIHQWHPQSWNYKWELNFSWDWRYIRWIDFWLLFFFISLYLWYIFLFYLQ